MEKQESDPEKRKRINWIDLFLLRTEHFNCKTYYDIMTKAFYLILTLTFFAACSSPESQDSEMDASVIETDNQAIKEPEMSFEHQTHDFGKITEGESVEHTFKFKNTGVGDLVISSCTASCGCTVPQWPREPIAPGKSGEIKVVFNSAGKGGLVSKDITILANTNPVKTVLQIKVDIDKK
jgi:hypothetical protein